MWYVVEYKFPRQIGFRWCIDTALCVMYKYIITQKGWSSSYCYFSDNIVKLNSSAHMREHYSNRLVHVSVKQSTCLDHFGTTHCFQTPRDESQETLYPNIVIDNIIIVFTKRRHAFIQDVHATFTIFLCSDLRNMAIFTYLNIFKTLGYIINISEISECLKQLCLYHHIMMFHGRELL